MDQDNPLARYSSDDHVTHLKTCEEPIAGQPGWFRSSHIQYAAPPRARAPPSLKLLILLEVESNMMEFSIGRFQLETIRGTNGSENPTFRKSVCVFVSLLL